MASRYLVTLSPDRIYASDLLRAYYTATPTAEKLALPIEKSEKLREIFAGKWEGMPFESIDVEYAEDYAVWKTHIGRSRPTDGESVAELMLRIEEELTRIVKENENKTVLVFLHATPIRAFAAKCLGLDTEKMETLPWATNASTSHFLYENGTFTLLEYSRDDYLGDISTALPSNV